MVRNSKSSSIPTTPNNIGAWRAVNMHHLISCVRVRLFGTLLGSTILGLTMVIGATGHSQAEPSGRGVEIPAASTPAGGTIIHDIQTPFHWYVPQGYPVGYPLNPQDSYEMSAPNDCGPASIAMVIRYLTQARIQPSPYEVRSADPFSSGRNVGTCAASLVTMLNAYGIPITPGDILGYTSDLGDIISQSVLQDHPVVVLFQADRVNPGPLLTPIYAEPGKPPPSCPQGKKCTTRDGVMYSWDDHSPMPDYNVGRYYAFPNLHWLVVKGIGQIGAERYAIVYDPAVFLLNNDYWYPGGYGDDVVSTKGFDRWYKMSELVAGVEADQHQTDCDQGICCKGQFVIRVPYTPGQISVARSVAAAKAYSTTLPASVKIEAIRQNTEITIPAGAVLNGDSSALKKWSVKVEAVQPNTAVNIPAETILDGDPSVLKKWSVKLDRLVTIPSGPWSR
jgi:hypothetical protein